MMKHLRLVGLVLGLLLAAAAAQAQSDGTVIPFAGSSFTMPPGTSAPYAAMFFLQGPCNGGDTTWQNNPPTVDPATSSKTMQGSPKLLPKDFPGMAKGGLILIYQIDFAFFGSGRILFLQSGNGGGTTDIMLLSGEGVTSGRSETLAGIFMPFFDRPDGQSYIDTHVACTPMTDSSGLTRSTYNLFVVYRYLIVQAASN